MMFAASNHTEYHSEYNPATGYMEYYESTGNRGLKTTGWIFVGAGLAASVSSAILIGISKRELSDKMGFFKIAAGSNGVGVQYNLPAKH